MLFKVLALFLPLHCTAMYPITSSTEEWLKVSLSEFSYNDPFIDQNRTKPEFSWSIHSGGKTVTRLANDEGILFSPLDVAIKPSLVLSEVDADIDRTIEKFELDFKEKTITFKGEKGSVLVHVSKIYPNSASGPDGTPEKATTLESPKAKSVNFNENDSIDYFRVSAEYPCVLVIARDPIIVESLLGEASILPHKKPGQFSIFLAKKPDLLRIRAVPGSNKSRYYLYPMPMNSCEEEALSLSYKFVLSEKIFLNQTFLRHWSNLFLELEGQSETDFCLKQSSKTVAHEVFCGYTLFSNPKREFRSYFRQYYQNRSKKAKKILRKLDFK